MDEDSERLNKNTDLFKIVEEGPHIACIQNLSFYTYSSGYIQACNKLLEDVESRMFNADSLFYPIFFLFRHYLEVTFKEILDIGPKYNKSSYNPERYGHDLNKLWRDAKECLRSFQPDLCTDDELEIMEKNIKKLHKKDPKATASRYPFEKGTNMKSFGDKNKKTTQVDLKQFKKSIKEISGFLYGCIDGMIDIKQTIEEVKRES